MYRHILIPTEQNHTIELPEALYGKEVEVVVSEIRQKQVDLKLPDDLKDKSFWEDIDYNPSFPSVDELRQTSWPLKK